MAHENATPRPWHADDENDVLDANGNPIAFTLGDDEAEEAANAALIVEAVNAYDTLRAENERLADRNSHLEGFLNGVIQLGDGNPKAVDLLVGLTRLCKEAQLLMAEQAQ